MRLFMKILSLYHEDPPVAVEGAVTPPAPVVAPTAPAPVPSPAGDTPWATDLAALGLDDTGRSAVDQYLRTKVQPHTTKLEQDLAQSAPARELFTDLQEDPEGTFMAVAEQLFEGADPNALRAALGLPPEVAEPVAPVAAPVVAEDPLLAEIREERAAAAREKQWNESMAPIRAADPTIKDEIFAPFVVATDADFEAAHEAYKAHVAELRAAAGIPADVPIVVPPPGVLGTGDAPGVVPQPIAPKYGSIDEAFDATMDEIRAAKAAPTVV